MAACTSSGCTRPVLVRARGLCSPHYVQWREGREPFSELLVQRHPGTRVERFWTKVDKSDGPDACWLWRAARTPAGYGVFGSDAARAHRVAYEFSHDITLPKGAVIMHTCDNPPCVNAKHLKRGTPAMNSRDMSRKGRSVRGERNSHARLTEADVRDIRRRDAYGERGVEIAAHFGITFTQMRNIVKRLQWKHVR